MDQKGAMYREFPDRPYSEASPQSPAYPLPTDTAQHLVAQGAATQFNLVLETEHSERFAVAIRSLAASGYPTTRPPEQ
jgi:hypothetical protein